MEKNKLKSLILQLAKHFSNEAPAPEEPVIVELKDVKGKDGKAYKVSALEVGGTIEVVDEAGQSAPAPDGEIELEDGTKIAVKEGKIESVTPAEEPKKEEAPAAPAAPTFNAEDFVPKAEFEKVVKQLDELNQKFEAIAKAANVSAETLKTMFAVVELLAKEPSANPTDAPKSNAFKREEARKERDVKVSEMKNAIDAAFNK